MSYIGYILCDTTTLNILNQACPWIPGSNNIRPKRKILEKKKEFLEELKQKKITLKQHIIETLFNNIPNQKLFVKNPFPYNIHGNHYVLWYYKYLNLLKPITNEMINNDITLSLYCLLGHYKFNYAWYENPKMSAPDENNDLYHVQVFWIKY